MNMQRHPFGTIVFGLLSISLAVACSVRATPTPLPNLPTFGPPPTISSTPSVDQPPESTPAMTDTTATVQPLELTPSLTLETATELPSPSAIPIMSTTELAGNCIA